MHKEAKTICSEQVSISSILDDFLSHNYVPLLLLCKLFPDKGRETLNPFKMLLLFLEFSLQIINNVQHLNQVFATEVLPREF